MQKFIILTLIALGQGVAIAHADEGVVLKDSAKIYQTDANGRTQYHKEHLTAEGNRLIPTNSNGQKQYHKQGYKIENGKVYETNSSSRTQYHKPAAKLP